MEEQNRQKPKIRPIQPVPKQAEPEAPKPQRKLPRFLVRTAATLVVLAAALARVAGWWSSGTA